MKSRKRLTPREKDAIRTRLGYPPAHKQVNTMLDFGIRMVNHGVVPLVLKELYELDALDELQSSHRPSARVGIMAMRRIALVRLATLVGCTLGPGVVGV